MELSADRQQWHWVVSDPIAGRKLGSIELSATLAVLIGGLAAMPARADEDDRGHNVQQQEGYDHDYGCPPAHRSYQHYYYRYEQRAMSTRLRRSITHRHRGNPRSISSFR